jgi:site-specific DNA-methyltransferase (adenine-specific)
VSKTGVFLREIVKRLDQGLKKKIPDQGKRINHILVNQVFGLAITELTALMARRTLYCSKTANGKYSICEGFKDAQGHLRFMRTEHSWHEGRCVFCGANQQANDRGSELETHAYTFIHTHEPEELFNMRFDVIVGNPPYQISDGGAKASAAPIYQKFVGQGIKLAPRYLSMIIPSRWFAGGKGLDEFRAAMLGDHCISKLVDYPDQNECFPKIDLSGGICYFLWERDRSDQEKECEVTTVISGQRNVLKRPLKLFQLETFIRYNQAVTILEKVRKKQALEFWFATRAICRHSKNHHLLSQLCQREPRQNAAVFVERQDALWENLCHLQTRQGHGLEEAAGAHLQTSRAKRLGRGSERPC